MKTIIKEVLLNIALYIFPLIFIISGISGSNVMYIVGFILAGIISVLMVLMYTTYIFTHKREELSLYRIILLIIEIIILLLCIYLVFAG
ncbi:hypothetical protein AKUA1404_04550 [Apilactobacillus kunkeei]|nr:hypothetical protein AKUA1404_04550 [Apilactobacillus kunkeei]